jgi:tRNA G18 (ribose-2'-O)-methylase SpoU
VKKREHETNISQRSDDVLKTPRSPIRLIVDNVRSLYNIGAMFRIGDSAFIEHIHLCGICGTPPRKEIQKTALETMKSIPWTYHEYTIDAINELKLKGYTIYAMELCDTSVHYDEAVYRFPCALIVGHEIDGISDEVLGLCDYAVDIPMYGIGVSLNVASATAVGITAMRRAWDDKHPYRS